MTIYAILFGMGILLLLWAGITKHESIDLRLTARALGVGMLAGTGWGLLVRLMAP